MLPDLPKLKVDLHALLMRHFSQQVRKRLGVINETPRQTLHEGNRMRTIRADGSMSDDNLKAASAEMTLRLEDVPTITPVDRLAQIDAMAEDMARQMSEHFFGTMNSTLEDTGQVVDLKGQRLNGEAILTMFEKMQFEFDADGRPNLPTVVVNPASSPAMRAAFEELQVDPLLRRFNELMRRKWMEWRDREASRKLVG